MGELEFRYCEEGLVRAADATRTNPSPNHFFVLPYALMKMNTAEAGFREIEHTADWELEVWAPDLPALFEQAARGMYALTGTRLQEGPRLERELEVLAADRESLLVAFLDEMLYLGEVEGLGFSSFEINLDENVLHAGLTGAPVASQVKEIKAVTYHNLAVRETERGFEARIVFDV